MATAAAHRPNVINVMSRARVPLIALTVALLAVDAIGLGLRWADASNNSLADVTPRVLQPRVTGPDAVVADGSGSSSSSGSDSTSSLASGGTTSPSTGTPAALIGPVAPPVASPNPVIPGTPNAPIAPAVPLAQLDVAIPGVAQVSLGLGDNSCTTIDLTLLALGNCPVPTGSGPVIIHLGGSLLGQKNAAKQKSAAKK